MNFTTALVEDDPAQRERLLSLLKAHCPGINVLGTASSVDEARRLFTEITPDLVFMDVLLPPHTSFDLLTSMDSIPFDVIFTTSYEEYAVRAFRLSAVDYLLKPIVREELIEAIHKFRDRRSAQRATSHLELLLENLRVSKSENVKIALPTLSGYLFVRLSEIVRCESDNTYTTFFTVDKRKIVVSRTLKECEQMLDSYRFFRVHNSHVINLDYIVEYVKGEGGQVRLADGSTVDVSRRRKEEFIQWLKK